MGVGTAPFARSVRVLIVDDDASMAEILRSSLSIIPASTCEIALNGFDGMQAVSRESFDVVVADVRMPGMDGFELLDSLRRQDPTLPVILVTANDQGTDAAFAAKLGAFEFLRKPLDLGTFRKTVQRALLERVESGTHPSSFERGVTPQPSSRSVGRALLGSAPSILTMLDSIERVAQSSAPVLVAGETGTGKDLVATLVHEKGQRRHKPFVAVNTTAIPATLLESELFGHVRGAFTGATQARRGLLVEADGGTLFLDEIGDMPLELQGTLLRVIETGEVRAVGSDRSRRVDVRIIAATHRHLPTLVSSGQFREDLYYRLNVLAIHVPSLRERRGDIPVLAQHFIDLARTRMPNARVTTLSPEALETLVRAPWPGNVRQLAATMERLVVLGKGAGIDATDLAFLEQPTAPEPAWPFGSFELCTLKTLNERYIGWVLAQCENDKARAAAILGVDISTLYRWQRRGPVASEPRPTKRR